MRAKITFISMGSSESWRFSLFSHTSFSWQDSLCQYILITTFHPSPIPFTSHIINTNTHAIFPPAPERPSSSHFCQAAKTNGLINPVKLTADMLVIK